VRRFHVEIGFFAEWLQSHFDVANTSNPALWCWRRYAHVVIHRVGVTLLIVAVCVVLVFPVCAVGAASAATNDHVRAGTVLTNTSLGGYTQLDQIDMLSPALGYAIATRVVGKDSYQYFLVRTTDLARRWTVVSEIPNENEFPIFSDFNTDDSDLSIDFVNRESGYVTQPGGRIYVTNDAGHSWSALAFTSHASSYAVAGSRTDVETTTCSSKNNMITRCRSELRQYAVGSTVPLDVRAVQTAGVRDPQNAAILAAPTSASVVVNLSNNNFSSAKSLEMTRDGGENWLTLDNPCTGSMIEQLLIASDGDWLLSCFHDFGMYHGIAQIFRSANQGATWTTVLDDGPQRDVKGNLNGGPVYLFFSGNDRILYSVALNPAGGLAQSTDGGTDWTDDRTIGNSGGSPGSIANFGPTSAIFQVFQGPVYETTNGRTWTTLPPLPAGRYRGMPVCTNHNATAKLFNLKSKGFDKVDVTLTNVSGGPCYLDGDPTLQTLKSGRDVGPSSTGELVNARPEFVTLKANGGTAHLPILYNPPTGRGSLPCRAATVSKLQLDFGSPSRFVVPLSRRISSICRASPNFFVNSVRRGTGKK
jgi:photosystem II stability/assembly factor-like uncharacterized protein